METYIKGHYRKSIYQNESGYTIGIFKVMETNEDDLLIYVDRTITFTGYFHELNDQDTYVFYGSITNHPRYGEQFQVTAYERVLPEENDAIIDFLTSGLFKGIGVRKAKKIVEVLGKDTLDTILNQPSNLLLIPTITEKNIKVLHDKLVEYESSYQIILELGEMGFSTKDSMALYNHYHGDTLTMVQNNIYRIPYEFSKMPFPKIDSIALNNGYGKDDINRLGCALVYVIQKLQDTTGHCYFFKEELKNYLTRFLKMPIENECFEEVVWQLKLDFQIAVYQDRYYLFSMLEAEKNIVRRLKTLSKKEEEKISKIDRYLEDLESFFEVKYNEEQKEAIKKAYQNHFCIITGGPGTGKTTILKAICELYRMDHKLSYEKLQQEIALLSLTGRASKRMSEATLLRAETIHRFLKWNKETNRFALNEYNKSDIKMVIIDESSMLDTPLLDSLLKALSYDTKIIMVGDAKQLPSVGPGQVLKDLIESGEVPVRELSKLYRQEEDSNILSLAYQVRSGHVEEDFLKEYKDFSFLPSNEEELKEDLLRLCTNYQNVDLRQFQVLVPMYKTYNGIDSLNQLLQEVFNPKSSKKKELSVGDVIYREHDKVIQLTNMPEDNVFNGDIGFITKIENGARKEIHIDFDGNLVKYTPSSFANFKHGFVISIHKSQGSEVNTVIMPILMEYRKMLYRKLVYTGITRAKKQLYLLGSKKALSLAVSNDLADERRSGILEFLQVGIKEEY